MLNLCRNLNKKKRIMKILRTFEISLHFIGNPGSKEGPIISNVIVVAVTSTGLACAIAGGNLPSLNSIICSALPSLLTANVDS